MTDDIDDVPDWTIAGEFFEACNCAPPCQCLYFELPDDGVCTGALFWHIEDGSYGDADVSGLTVGLLLYEQGVLLEGGWDTVVLIDEAATAEQTEALESIFLGRAGGLLGAVADLVDEVKAVSRVPITYSAEDGRVSMAAGDVVTVELDTLEGFGDVPGEVSPHPLTPPTERATTGTSSTATVSYDEQFSWDVSGNNAYLGEFEYGNG
ncbi:DUF1326 domain-containing protein [Natronobeatus ordinarius]|uniref:DUF1326 domain-containing protein n=1 Tax=Natronobeatus ordinarius TaxID=2963433 RepID=UPI0020CE91AC|nr:DUF1326 domain-containing protein [Natronobeatus ordinarius]